MLYHGSKINGLHQLEPRAHGAVDGEKVVFATPDRFFALSMIHGTGNQLALDYTDDGVFLDEIESDALQLLNQSGYLYTLKDSGFIQDNRLIPQEVISYKPTDIVHKEYIPNILEALADEGITLVPYDEVPTSMKSRKTKTSVEYHDQRFKSLE